MIPKNKADIGVVVGRFQVHQLHPGHVEILDFVYKNHTKMYVVLGLSVARTSTKNPLDFESRKAMILAKYPKATVLYIKDCRDDQIWSTSLDALINDIVDLPGSPSICLYGGRDSFINHYSGRFPAVELEPTTFSSATEARKTIGKVIRESDDFRAGVIWATQNGYPRVYPTVDIAVMKGNDVLLVRKPGEGLWRFPGGFVQPSDGSFENAARRELMEETGIECGDLEYVLSARVDDWRYRSEDDKIITTFYKTTHIHGGPRPADDVAEAMWWPSNNIRAYLVPEHVILGSAL